MRPALPASSPRLVQRPLRDRLHVQTDLRSRLRHLLGARAEACTRTLADVLRQRTGIIQGRG
jgi:hypothetical protein